MDKLEQQEIESIRLELHDMFKNSPERPAIVFRITSRLWKLSHKKNSMRQMADEIKTSIEKIIAKHEDRFCSSWAELRREIFEAIDYHLTTDAIPTNTMHEDIIMIKTIINDSKIISGLYGENENWQITLDSVDKIEAYLEDDNSVWFTIDRNGKTDQRINSRYVEFIVYL